MLNCNEYNLVIVTSKGEYVEKYVKLLKKNDLKVTPQRIKILKYLDTHRTHSAVGEIYSFFKKSIPSLSKTTVYNSLDTLKEHGLIQALSICGSEHRYDFKNEMHHHFLCKKCGKIYDIDFKCPNIKEIRKEIESSGHHIKEVHGYFKGTCNECYQMEKNSE